MMYPISVNRPPSSLCFHLKPKLKLLPKPTLLRSHTSTNVPFLLPPKPTPQKPQPHLLSSLPLTSLKPYILSQRKPIFLGWLGSLVSVYSLSKTVPKMGKFPALVGKLDPTTLKNEGLAVGVLVLARLVAAYWQQAFLWEAALTAANRVRTDVFEKVLERDLVFFEGNDGVSSGDVAYRLTAEASDVADTVYALLNTTVPSALQLLAMAAQMLAISPLLSLISAVVIPCMALVVVSLGEKLRKISKKAQLTIAALSAYLNEVLPAILFVKASNAELSENARFRELARADLSAHLEKKKMKSLIPQIIQIIYFGVLFMLCAGSLVFTSGSFDSSDMGVGKAYNELKQGEPAIQRLFDLTRFKSKIKEKSDAVNLDHVAGDVKFCDVSFKYKDSMPYVLNGLNLHIKAGETVALVGPSGGGKTTLAKLLLRLYDPLFGSILIDYHNIQSIKLTSLRRHVGLVSQDITLFSGTVSENIGYRDSMTEINMEMVEDAARTANADEFIRNLPEGYETNIGPRGSSLSGGQKQRLAIARALYQDSAILILDEATSALDSRSELLVREAVQRLMENHTILVIAHRLETVMMAKRVFLLDDGKLEEVTGSSLLSRQDMSWGL